MIRGAASALLLLLLPIGAWAAQPPPARPEVHVLAIGSEHYAEAPTPDDRRFVDLPDIAESTGDVAETFRKRGARSVRLLVSEPRSFVSRQDVLDALDATLASVSLAKKSLVVVYFAGHGISEGLGWTHYSVPGSLVYQGPLGTLASRDGIERSAIATAELYDRLARSGIPFLLVLDNCREGSPVDTGGVAPMIGESGQTLVDSVRDGLRLLNRFGGPNPVIFSTEPGTQVSTAEHPNSPTRSIGPLGRRLLLAAQARDWKEIALGALVARLRDPGFDRQTGPGVTFAEAGATTDWVVLRRSTEDSPVIRLPATGRLADPCCNAAMPTVSAVAVGLRGVVKVLGAPAGHWLINGEPRQLRTPAASLTGTLSDPATITIHAAAGPQSWSLILAAPVGETLARKAYEGATRAPFQDTTTPGLAFSTSGKSCNENTGRFVVSSIRTDGNRLRELKAKLDLRCDTIPGVIHIAVDVASE